MAPFKGALKESFSSENVLKVAERGYVKIAEPLETVTQALRKLTACLKK